MADYIVKDTELTSVANAIRTAGGTNSLLSFPNGFVSAVNNIGGGGGGQSWTTLTEESVTTVADEDSYEGNLAYSTPITADTIKVTFDSVEYICNRRSAPNNNCEYGALWDDATESYDFSEFPFKVNSSRIGNLLVTESAGTYSIKIEAPQSGGGSSDFSTAQVTFVNNTADKVLLGATALVLDEGEHSCVYGRDALANNGSYTFILYKGLNVFTCNDSDQFTVTTSGNVNYENGTFLITGDCTITIS